MSYQYYEYSKIKRDQKIPQAFEPEVTPDEKTRNRRANTGYKTWGEGWDMNGNKVPELK